MVQPACPVSSPCGNRRRQSSSTWGPPARWIAPSTPPPPRILELAALTTASTSCSVMSPSTTERIIRPSSSAPRVARTIPAIRGETGETDGDRAEHRPERSLPVVVHRPILSGRRRGVISPRGWGRRSQRPGQVRRERDLQDPRVVALGADPDPARGPDRQRLALALGREREAAQPPESRERVEGRGEVATHQGVPAVRQHRPVGRGEGEGGHPGEPVGTVGTQPPRRDVHGGVQRGLGHDVHPAGAGRDQQGLGVVRAVGVDEAVRRRRRPCGRPGPPAPAGSRRPGAGRGCHRCRPPRRSPASAPAPSPRRRRTPRSGWCPRCAPTGRRRRRCRRRPSRSRWPSVRGPGRPASWTRRSGSPGS